VDIVNMSFPIDIIGFYVNFVLIFHCAVMVNRP